ncbi:MAG: DNA polymerase III subunit delta, partial [Steroidobacteraceae bacterium]|nr:DNA polymerase III subunit delta [Steroidobacteraceae bacterium]
MKITRDELPNVLATGRYRTWLVSGDEPLLVGECADAIRKHARGTGCTDREVYFVERNFDWNVLRQSAASLSLFGARRLIEVRLPSGKPGVDGAQVL